MKQYSVIIGGTHFYIKAHSIKEARGFAQLNKRHLGYKGKTEVRLSKIIS